MLRERGIPFGFCGICEFCGDFGHLRHYPGPVPATGSWCDVCYKVEAHFAPLRDTGIWVYDSEHDRETFNANAEAFEFHMLLELLSSIRKPKSALVINLLSNIWIDFRVKPDGNYQFNFSDHKKGFFAHSDLEFDSAEKVLQIALQNRNVKDEFDKLELHFDYFEE